MQGKNNILNEASAWFCTFATPEPERQEGTRALGLLKPKPQLAVKDSNMANFGTKIEYDIKKESAKGEAAYQGAGQREGLAIWRVNKFKLEIIDQKLFGQFYSGDSYIILNTIKTKENNFTYDVHFWLGADTTQDEAGTAAYKTVELDNLLDRKAVQHREVMGHESELFLSYFTKLGGLRLLEGGADTGFHHVEPKQYKPRLLHMKGRKQVRVKEVPISGQSLNAGDGFVLDNGLDIYQWVGKEASIQEKTRATQLSSSINSERGGKTRLHHETPGAESEEFWKLLGGKTAIANASLGGEDDPRERALLTSKKLYKLSDATGKVQFTKVSEGVLDRNDVTSKDAFVLDNAQEIFVYLGKECSLQEAQLAPKYAMQYMEENGRPAYLPLTIMKEGSQNETFENSFDKNAKGKPEEVVQERVFVF